MAESKCGIIKPMNAYSLNKRYFNGGVEGGVGTRTGDSSVWRRRREEAHAPCVNIAKLLRAPWSAPCLEARRNRGDVSRVLELRDKKYKANSVEGRYSDLCQAWMMLGCILGQGGG